jgi:transposase-like protein
MGAPRQKLEAIGIDAVCDMLAEGHSLRTVSRELGVNWMTLHDWLHSTPLQSARTSAAIKMGAEAHEERAVRILEDARQEIADTPELANPIVTLARERAQAAWRQAGLRDRRFSDAKSAELTVTHKHDIQSISTPDLERLVAQQRDTLQLLPDGTVEGGASDSDEAGA